MRKLATIRRIDKLEPIPGADLIWKATIGGWELVTARDNGFKEGDLVIYLEIDSWVPHELAPFLSKGNEPRVYNGVKGERLKTIKLRGQISQGLILPLNVLDKYGEYWKCHIPPNKWSGTLTVTHEEGSDCTEYLNIQKWEKEIPAQLAGQCRGNFPSFLRKTDQERCQNLKREIFERNIDTQYEVSVKLDGSSMTVYYYNDHQEERGGVCSRNLDLKLDQIGNAFVDLATQNTLTDSSLLEALANYCQDVNRNFALQGELCGPGIQGNKDGFEKNRFSVFDIFDIDNQQYLSPAERMKVFEGVVGFMNYQQQIVYHVPVLHTNATLADMLIDDIKDLLAYAEGKSYFGKTQSEREGLVFKSVDGQFSFKAISNRFLSKGGDD